MRPAPLNALRAFEATARLQSARHAADELFVTPAAISQHLRSLEEDIGRPLFRKSGRGMELTDVGEALFARVSKPLRQIFQAVEAARPSARRARLVGPPSFCSKWLAPRMADFFKRRPELEARIDALLTPAALEALREREADLALVEMTPPLDGFESALLLPAPLIAVASPSTVRRLGSSGSIDWSRAELLHDAADDKWAPFLSALGLSESTASRGLHFSYTMMALEAAAEGSGVALATPALIERELERGQLQRLPAASLDTGRFHALVWRSGEPLSEPAEALRSWIVEQAALSLPALRALAVAPSSL